MLRCEEGNLPVVRQLLSQGGFDVNAANKSGHTALALAVKAGDQGVLQELLSQGAEIDRANNVNALITLF